jgi:hypothetical protein
LFVWQKIIKVTSPYFYIIEHKPTGKKYAGSRWAKGCHPDEFMKVDGYCTSSPIVKGLIESDGLDAFKILTIERMDDPYAYETEFLIQNNCADSDEWINRHNNTGMAFGSKEFTEKAKATCINRYGVDHSTKMPAAQAKRKLTTLERYGVENPACSEVVKQKIKTTSLKKYGVDCNLKDPETQARIKATTLKKYGVECVFSIDVFRKKAIQTKLKRYGVPYVAGLPEIKEKIVRTNIERYSCPAPAQNPEIMQKQIDTNLARYGTAFTMQNKDVKAKATKTLLEKYGVDNISKLPFLSIIATKRTYAKNVVSTFFPEFKQYY